MTVIKVLKLFVACHMSLVYRVRYGPRTRGDDQQFMEL